MDNRLRGQVLGEVLTEQVKENIDVLMILETKVDDTFPIRNFLINGFGTLYYSDRHLKSAGVMLFFWEDIPSNLLTIENEPIEGLYVESNLRNDKWLYNCSYNPHKNTNIDKLTHSSLVLLFYTP